VGEVHSDHRPNRKRGRRLAPGLLRRVAAARYCAVGVSTWDRWTAAGLVPAPVKITGVVSWSRDELAEWCRQGCPPRIEWIPLWAAIRIQRQRRT
jgi:predicted DNA-binding transcriptional regulator AlpA